MIRFDHHRYDCPSYRDGPEIHEEAFQVQDNYEKIWDKLIISTDFARIDVNLVFDFLHNQAYWCLGIPRDVVERAIHNSLCFGAYFDGKQAGFARVISDYATYAYLSDVFILPEYRNRGFSKRLMETIMAHPKLQGLRRFHLVTRDAHGLYEQFGFSKPVNPEKHMEKIVQSKMLYSSET